MPSPQPLQALGGQPAPEEVERDLALVLALPPSARARLWEVLGPCLTDAPADALEARLDAFCQAHAAPAEMLARAVKACRFLVRQAASRGLPREAFAADLAALPAPEAVRDVLLAGYDAGTAQVRRELFRGALADHGNLLEGVDWRVDQVATSSRGGALHEPVGVITLRYRAARGDDRLTVQVLPDALRELRDACEAIAAAARRLG